MEQEDNASIAIQYMSISQEAAFEFFHHLLAFLPTDGVDQPDQYTCVDNSHVDAEGMSHPYFIATVRVSGDPEAICNALNEVMNGAIHEMMDLEHKLSVDSIRSYPLLNNQLELLQTVGYLHNKSQTTSYEVKYLQEDLAELRGVAEHQQKMMELMTEKYASLHAFLHNYIDIIGVKSVVIELARIVDEDLFGQIKIVNIH